MPLSRIEFLVLNNLADEPEAFSSVYLQLLDDLGESGGDVGYEDAAAALAGLCALGLAESVNGGAVEADAIAAHYEGLDDELVEHVNDPLLREEDFAFSGGEWAYQITGPGGVEWEKPEYASYYPRA